MTTEQTELIEKLNCLEFETSQLNHAYQQWRSYAEQGTVPDWMAAAARVTYDALTTSCLDTMSALALDTSRAGETDRGPRTTPVLRGLGWPDRGPRTTPVLRGPEWPAPPPRRALLAEESMTALCVQDGRGLQCNGEASDRLVRSTVLIEGSLALTPVRQPVPMIGELITEQAELIEKLNCLEIETSQLSHAYQQWRSYVEQGTAPDWMAGAIRITYDALITFCLDTVSAPASDTSHDDEIDRGPRTTPGLRGPGRLECHPPSETAPPPEPALLAKKSMTTLCLRHGHRVQYEHALTDPPVYFTALIDGSLALTPLRQQNRIAEVLSLADVSRALSVRQPAQLEAAAGEIAGIVEEESATAEPSTELLTMTEPDWSEPEMSVVISPSSGDAISEPSATHQDHQEEEAGSELVAIHIPTTLAKWLQRSSSSRLSRATAVAVLMVAGAAIGIYVASTHGAGVRSGVPLAAGAVAIPTAEKAGFKFDPDPVVTRPGSPFVLNAVLTQGSDIASVGAEIDYDANLLEFMGASQGGLLVKAGQKFVLAQRNDPLTGVVKIGAEQSPGSPGISGDGAVFALSFQARKKGKANVSIIPGAHDSQGRRIETAGSQVSVAIH